MFMATDKIMKRSVDALDAGEKDLYLWDSELAGFCVKVTPTGRKVYLVQYRIGGRGGATKRVTIGIHGTFTPDQARDKARNILAQVSLGKDPAAEKTKQRKEITISELTKRYLEEHAKVHNKPSTIGDVERIIETKIKPVLGKHKITDLTRSHVKAWHHDMRATPYEANRALAYCSKMMSLASGEWELRADNPCRGVKKFQEKKRERFFSEEELKRIGTAINEAKNSNLFLVGCIHAISLLALTGCRLGEIINLAWDDVDISHGCIRLKDAKAGARTVPLGIPTLSYLDTIERDGKYVVHGIEPDEPLADSPLRRFWEWIKVEAKIPGSRPHDFRHTSGTYAAQAGFNAFLIRDLLGHKTMAMTGRYVERAIDPLRAAADSVSGRVSDAMQGIKKSPKK